MAGTHRDASTEQSKSVSGSLPSSMCRQMTADTWGRRPNALGQVEIGGNSVFCATGVTTGEGYVSRYTRVGPLDQQPNAIVERRVVEGLRDSDGFRRLLAVRSPGGRHSSVKPIPIAIWSRINLLLVPVLLPQGVTFREKCKIEMVADS